MNRVYYKSGLLEVRPLTESDYEAFVFGYENALPPQNRFDEGKTDVGFMSVQWYRQLLQRRRQDALSDYSYMLNIFRVCDGASVGYCDITPHRREDFQYARVGYTIHNNFWGLGYGTDALTSMIHIGFDTLRLHRLEAHINTDNPASKRVALKAGLKFEGLREAFILEDGCWTDNEIYYLNNPAWQPIDAGGAKPHIDWQ